MENNSMDIPSRTAVRRTVRMGSMRNFRSLKRPSARWRQDSGNQSIGLPDRMSVGSFDDRIQLRRHSDTTVGKGPIRSECCPHRHVTHSPQPVTSMHSQQTTRDRRSGLDSIGVDYMRINGAVSGFKQLKRAEEFKLAKQTKSFSSVGSVPEIDVTATGKIDSANTALLSMDSQRENAFQERKDAFAGSRQQKSAQSVGYRLGKRKELFEKRKRISDYSLAFACFGLTVMILETELTMAKTYDKNSIYSIILKSLITISTFGLIGLIFGFHVLEIKLFSCDDCIEDWRIAITWRRVAQMFLEVVVCIVHPVAGNFTFSWNTYMINKTKQSKKVVSLDLLLSLPMFLRLYLIFRVMVLHSKLFSDAGSRSIGAMNKVSFNTRFVLKTLMTICPGTVLLIFILSMWLLFSWTMRACESYHDDQFANILNSMWLISVTFLSIGYGDIVPHTYCGRAIAIATGVMGSACTALIVAVFARKLELSKAEKHVIHFMMENQLTKKVKSYAANVLRETWLIYKYTKLVKRVNPGKVRSHQRKFLRAIHGLRQMKIDQRKLQDNSNTLVDLAKTQTNIYETVTDMRVEQNCFTLRMEEIESSLVKLQENLINLPHVVRTAVTSAFPAEKVDRSQFLHT